MVYVKTVNKRSDNVPKNSHTAVRHNSDRVSRATLNWLKGSSFLGISLLSA